MSQHDDYLANELKSILRPNETVLNTGLAYIGPGLLLTILLLGGLLQALMMKYYYAVATNERIILIKTKMGFAKLQMVNQGIESIEYNQIATIKPAAFVNQKRIGLTMKDGKKYLLRFNTIARQVSGQKEFYSEVPERIQQKIQVQL